MTGGLILQLPGTLRGPRRLLMAHVDTVPLCIGAEFGGLLGTITSGSRAPSGSRPRPRVPEPHGDGGGGRGPAATAYAHFVTTTSHCTWLTLPVSSAARTVQTMWSSMPPLSLIVSVSPANDTLHDSSLLTRLPFLNAKQS